MLDLMDPAVLLDAEELCLDASSGSRLDALGVRIGGDWFLLRPSLVASDGDPEEILELLSVRTSLDHIKGALSRGSRPPACFLSNSSGTVAHQALTRGDAGRRHTEFRGMDCRSTSPECTLSIVYELDAYELPGLTLTISPVGEAGRSEPI